VKALIIGREAAARASRNGASFLRSVDQAQAVIDRLWGGHRTAFPRNPMAAAVIVGRADEEIADNRGAWTKTLVAKAHAVSDRLCGENAVILGRA